MTYLLMSLPFLGIGTIVFLIGSVHARRKKATRRYFSSWAATTAVLFVLTAVFDNAMMAAGFFDYGAGHISGIRLGLMPIEDFLYPLAGALLLAGLWQVLGGSSTQKEGHND